MSNDNNSNKIRIIFIVDSNEYNQLCLQCCKVKCLRSLQLAGYSTIIIILMCMSLFRVLCFSMHSSV